MRLFLLLIFTHLAFVCFGQNNTYQGIVHDSIGNPVYKAEVCLFNPLYTHVRNCEITDRWGKYRIKISEGSFVSIRIKYELIPDVVKIYEYKEDPFDGFGYLTEYEKVEDNLKWEKILSNSHSESYPIKKRKEEGYYHPNFSKVQIEGDSARLLVDNDYVKGRLGFDLDLSYSVSEHLKTPKLQNQFIQGRPVDGAYTYTGPPEEYSWGPSSSLYPDFIQYDPNRIFRKAEGFTVGFNSIYERKGRHLSFNYVNNQEQGMFHPIKTHSNNFKANYNFPLWGGRLNTSAGLSMDKTEMPLIGNNYMNVLYSAWNSPYHFDTQTLTEGGSQSTASDRYNNPEFLLSYNRDLRKNNTYNFGTDYTVQLNNWKVGGALAYSYSSQKLEYGQIPEMVQLLNPEFFNRKLNTHWASLKLNSIFTKNQIYLKFDWIHQLDISQLQKDTFSGYTSLENFPNGGSVSRMYTKNKQRYNSNLSAKMNYNLSLDDVTINNELTQALYFTTTNEQAIAYQLNNRLTLDSDYLLGDFKFLFGLNTEISYSEPDLISQNLNFNSLNQSLNDFVHYSEPYELILNNKLKQLQEKRLTEVSLTTQVNDIFRLDFSYSYFKVNDAFAPIFKDGNFSWENVADYHQQGIDINLSNGRFLNSSQLNWDFQLNFQTYKNKTDRILNGEDRIPYFGFSEVSKNFIEGQSVGVLVGNDFLRDDLGRLVIGDDGFPLVDGDLKVIADPNPDFTMNLYNKVKFKSFSLSFNFEWQKGGQVWNGTGNTLNYFGRSQLTADLRNTTGFIFDGVNTNGQPNTIPVDFSNPMYDVNENLWTRYGITGVASDAIEDATFFRLQNVTLTYQTKLRKYHYSPITQFSVAVFARNLWVSSNYSGVFPQNGLLGNESGVGMDYFNYPLARVVGISMNLKF